MSAPLSAQRCLPPALPSRPSLGCHRHCPAWLPNRYRTVVRELSGLRMLRVSYWTGRSGPGPAPPSDSKNDGSCASHSGTCFPCVAPVRKSVPRLVFIFFFYFNCSFSIFFPCAVATASAVLASPPMLPRPRTLPPFSQSRPPAVRRCAVWP